MISKSSSIIIILSIILSCTVTFLAANDGVAGAYSAALGTPRLSQYVATANEHYSATDKTFHSANTQSREDILTSHRRSRDQLLANQQRWLSMSGSWVAASNSTSTNTSSISNIGNSSSSRGRRARRGAIVRFEVEPYQMWALPINYMINSSFSGNNTLLFKLKTSFNTVCIVIF